ncbi:tetratricopeptide repeat protein, partial [Robiginitalea sp.]|uniref:tetratricopeptide repeat protein n=1 Tax=Robiginitalea sp. TaxID=1902411 RepID=UPI003C71533D
ALITKEEFRTGFYIYNFAPKEKDSATSWLEFGISRLLLEDLLKNKNLSPDYLGLTTTPDKVKESSYFHEYYIDGEFKKTDSTFILTTYIRNAKNAKIIEETTVEGPDILDLIDDVTVFITNSFNSEEFNSPNYLDMNIREITSDNLKALEYFSYGDYENAIVEDSTFALAYLFAGRRNLRYSQGNMEEQALADKAYELRYQLPLQRQSETLVQKYLAYDQFDDAEKLVKLQLEVDPSSDTYNQTLRNIYGRTRNVEAYTELANQAWENDKNRISGVNVIDASLIQEDYEEVLDQLTTFARLQGNDPTLMAFKLLPQLYKGDLGEAHKTLDRFKLLQPELKVHSSLYEKTLDYLEANPVTPGDLRKFEGEYRGGNSEQTSTFWVHKNTLLQYVSNQDITPLIMGGEQTLVSGHPAIGQTGKKEFFENSNGEFYAFRYHQYSWQDSLQVWYWKLDDAILKAENLMAGKQWDSAQVAYEEAIAANPNHYYLKYPLAHLKYRDSVDSQAYINQLREVEGTYSKEGVDSKRRFWVQDGRLFYKRDGVASKVLLPVSKTRYINMVDQNVHFEFEYKDGEVVASYVSRFDPDTKLWQENWESEINYLPKD